MPPQDAVAAIGGYLTGKRALPSARPDRGKARNFRGEHVWARGDFASTVGADEQKVRESIGNQEEEDMRLAQLQLFKSD